MIGMKYLVLFMLLTSVYGCDRRKPLETGLEGKPLPAFEILLNDSITHINTGKAPVGKPVVLFYFNPNCPYCQAEMTDIVGHIGSLKDIRFYIFTCAPFRVMKGFYTYFGLAKYPNISVGIDDNHFFEKKFSPYGVPYTAIYDKDKRLVHAYLGKMRSSQIKDIAAD
jgi:thiol-disulfide isomerase/thioredoxin